MLVEKYDVLPTHQLSGSSFASLSSAPEDRDREWPRYREARALQS